jgi:3-deoxy-D-manno-octulosonate 8-phosphate phosphatase (KDO 8-P phosphatase)
LKKPPRDIPSSGDGKMNKRLIARALRIRLAIFDVDGVLTDGTIYLSERGEEMKAFHVLDGLGLKMLKADGIVTALLSGRKSKMVAIRAKEIGIAHLMQGVDDKLDTYRRLLRKLGLAAEETSFMGDDLPDLPILRRCGLAFSVPNAPEVVRSSVHHVTDTVGGRGAAREACEFLLRARGTLDNQLRTYLA